MIELVLEFFFGVTSVAGAKKNKALTKPYFVAILSLWLIFILSITLIFG